MVPPDVEHVAEVGGETQAHGGRDGKWVVVEEADLLAQAIKQKAVASHAAGARPQGLAIGEDGRAVGELQGGEEVQLAGGGEHDRLELIDRELVETEKAGVVE